MPSILCTLSFYVHLISFKHVLSQAKSITQSRQCTTLFRMRGCHNLFLFLVSSDQAFLRTRLRHLLHAEATVRMPSFLALTVLILGVLGVSGVHPKHKPLSMSGPVQHNDENPNFYRIRRQQAGRRQWQQSAGGVR